MYKGLGVRRLLDLVTTLEARRQLSDAYKIKRN